MRRNILLFLVVLLLAGAFAFYWLTRPLPVLTVTSWAGSYGRAQADAMMRPYQAQKRVDVRQAIWDGDLNDIARAVASRTYKGDVIDFELPKAVEACRRGLLEKMDTASLPAGADGRDAAHDFVAGALGPCWVGSVVYSQAIVFAPGSFAGPQPTTLHDFFDTAQFPGPRALRQGAKFNLEMALLADGVAPDRVYATLARDAGVARALAKLATLRPTIVWWRAAGEPVTLIRSHAAVFSTVLNSEIYDAARGGPPLGAIWDSQLYELDVFGVPKGDPRRERAMDFVRFATGSAALAGVADWVPFGPARRSALALVGKNPELGIPMRNWLPTAHFQTAFAVDDSWWADNAARIAPLWQVWMDGNSAPAAAH